MTTWRPDKRSKVKLTCPNCSNVSQLKLSPPRSRYIFECDECEGEFECEVYHVRAKRSRGDRKRNRRDFDIGVIDLGDREHFVEFEVIGWDDIEMRQGDLIVLYYQGDRLAVVDNVTIGVYTAMPKIRAGCAVLLALTSLLTAGSAVVF